MKILVYGSGVIGSIFGGRLQASGHDVTMLARGDRLNQLRQLGLVIDNTATGQRSTAAVSVCERLADDAAYDLVLVAVRGNQVAAALPELAHHMHTPNVVFLCNTFGGPEALIAALGRERVVLGYPGAGGRLIDGVVHYQLVPGAVQPTMLGEVDGSITPRLSQIETAFRGAGFAVQVSNSMDAWLKSHAVLISAAANALMMAGCDNLRLARTRDGLILTVRAVREGLRVLRANGVLIEPAHLKLIEMLPEPLLVEACRRAFQLPFAELSWASYVRVGRDELRWLADDFAALAARTSVPTPAMAQLRSYIDAATPALEEGSSSLPLDWRGVTFFASLIGIAASAVALASAASVGRRRRRHQARR
jgi:2-dehydropantoate 2-reductase